MARALTGLPLISGRMASGQFSYSKIRALTRVATPQNEAELIGFAEHGTVAQVERLVQGWRRIDRQEDLADEKLRHTTRSLSVFPGEDGMYVVRGRLDPEVGSLLIKALEAASEALYPADPDASATQRRADALAEILKGEGGSVHAVLQISVEGTQTDEGVYVPAETSERLTCDAEVTVVRRDATSGAVLDVGRRRRTVTGREIASSPGVERTTENRLEDDVGCGLDGRHGRTDLNPDTARFLWTEDPPDYGWALSWLRGSSGS